MSVLHTWVDAQGGAGVPDASLYAQPGTTGNYWTVYLKFTTTEPMLHLSPWLDVPKDSDSPGMQGINNCSFQLNLDSTCRRVFSTGKTAVTTNADGYATLAPQYLRSVQLQQESGAVGLTNTKILMNLLSMSPEQIGRLSSSKNVVPYKSYPVYKSSNTSNAAMLPAPARTAGAIPAALVVSPLTSQSIQLNQIPDRIFIAARLPMSEAKWGHTNGWLPIKSIAVTFNNAGGLLSTASQQDLFDKVSCKAGSGQTWQEFSGVLNTVGELVPGIGSVLVIDPSQHFNLPSYLSASVLGQYQFAFQLNVVNPYSYSVTPELVIICENSGVFSTMSGTSSIETGLLTKDAVLSVKSSGDELSRGDFDKLVGGGRQCGLARGGVGASGGGISGGVGMSGGTGFSGGSASLSRFY